MIGISCVENAVSARGLLVFCAKITRSQVRIQQVDHLRKPTIQISTSSLIGYFKGISCIVLNIYNMLRVILRKKRLWKYKAGMA